MLVCSYCNIPLDEYSQVPVNPYINNTATKDHITPKKRGGKLNKENKIMACFDCNTLKGNRDLPEFYSAIDLVRHETVRNFKRNMSRYKKMYYNIKKLINDRERRKQETEFKYKEKRGTGRVDRTGTQTISTEENRGDS